MADEEMKQDSTPSEGANPKPQMQPITNPELVEAMTEFRKDLSNRDNERAFLQAAVSARYLLPAMIQPIPKEEGHEDEPQQHSVAFQIMNTPDGKKFMPAFTSQEELLKHRKEGESFQVAVMGFEQIYMFMKGNEPITGVVIDPFGCALCLNRGQIIAIGDAKGDITVGMAPQQPAQKIEVTRTPVQAPTNVLGAAENTREQQQAAIRAAMQNLDNEPQENKLDAEQIEKLLTDDVLGALKGCLKKQKNVKKAYIQPMIESGEKFFLLALEADDSADMDAINSAIASDCADYSDLPFDCVPATSIRAKELVANEKPFYEKKRFGIF